MTRHRGGRGRPRAPHEHGGAGTPREGWLRELAAIAADPARWPALDEDTLLLLAFQQCLWLAHSGETSAATALAELYPHLAGRVARAERMELLERVTSAVEEGGTPVAALSPFLQHEPDAELVSLAAGAYASLAPLEHGDPLTGPHVVLGMAAHAEDPRTRAGLVAGVLELGDARALPALAAAWEAIGDDGREALAALEPPGTIVFAATARFWLEALERAPVGARPAVAAALARLARRADPPRVLDVRRKFPAHAEDDRETIEILSDAPLAEFARTLAPRLDALGDAPALAQVRAAWGAPGGA
jgi:hypothetical protein